MTSAATIAGASFETRRVIADERGAVLHFLRADSPSFSGFGEIYFSTVIPGRVKGWKRHRRQTQRFAVPVGMVKVVLYDDRVSSPSCGDVAEFLLGMPDHYGVLIIPPMIWYAFAAVGTVPGLVANCADIPHDPDESERMPLDPGPVRYAW